MWQYLNQHPELVSTKDLSIKELGFFSNLYGINDEEKYKSYFKRDKDQLAFEVCHSYISSPESSFLIKENVPGARIIAILRNPVDRAYSLYNWMTAAGFEKCKTFENALAKESDRILSRHFRRMNPQYYYNYLYMNSGLYYIQLKRYIRLFDRDKIHYILYDDLKERPHFVLNGLCSFLGVSEFKFQLNKIHNKGTAVRNPFFQYILRNYASRLTSKLMLGSMSSNPLLKLLSNLNSEESVQPLSQKTRRKLLSYYSEDIKHLEELIQKPIVDKWL